jgi:hypothetical protein
MEEMKNFLQILFGKPQGTRPFGDLSVGGRITLG